HVLAPTASVPPTYQVHPHPAWHFPGRLGVSPAMRRALWREAGAGEGVPNHGLWMMPNLYPAWAGQGRACRLITSPRGTLSPWARRRSVWLKRLMWLFGQGRAIRASHGFHATAENEYHDIRAAGLRGPVAIVPNGIDIGPEPDHAPTDNGRRRLLFVGRLPPLKGIDRLLQAWHRVQAGCPTWELQLVGDGEPAHVKQLKQMADHLGVRRATFFGPAFGVDKRRQYQQAELFVLPTHSENFGLVVAEALAHGVPAIVTKGAP